MVRIECMKKVEVEVKKCCEEEVKCCCEEKGKVVEDLIKFFIVYNVYVEVFKKK